MAPPKQVAVPAPDPALPPSFDGENPAHRYRFLEPQSQWMVRPIVEAHGWDHESGVEGFSVDKGFCVAGNSIPGNMSGQFTKDKKDQNVGFEGQLSIPHAKTLVTTSGVDVQTVGEAARVHRAGGDAVEVLRGEQDRRRSSRRALVGGAVALGTKLENRWKVTPGAKLVAAAGAVSANKDVAYGGNCECVLRHSDDPSNPNSSTVGMSFMNWRGRRRAGGQRHVQHHPRQGHAAHRARQPQLEGRGADHPQGDDERTIAARGARARAPDLRPLVGRIRGD